MIAAGVVGDDIDDDLDISGMCLRDQVVNILQCSEERIHVSVISYVVSTVVQRRCVEGGEPQGIDTERLEVIKAADDSGDITHPIALAIGKGSWINLIHDGIAPPGAFVMDHLCLRHWD